MARVYRPVLERKTRAALAVLGSWLNRRAIEHLDGRRFQGAVLNSIGWRYDGPFAILWGSDRRIAPHAVYLEMGFRPHWVPYKYASAYYWARRVAPQWANKKGLYVGGPGSVLKTGPGGASGLIGPPKAKRWATWYTTAGTSKWLPNGKVGWPFLRPALEDLYHRKDEVIRLMTRRFREA